MHPARVSNTNFSSVTLRVYRDTKLIMINAFWKENVSCVHKEVQSFWGNQKPQTLHSSAFVGLTFLTLPKHGKL